MKTLLLSNLSIEFWKILIKLESIKEIVLFNLLSQICWKHTGLWNYWKVSESDW